MVGGITAGIFIGKSIESVGFGLIIAFCVNFFLGFYMLIKVALKKSMINFLRSLVFPLSVSVFMSIILWIFSFAKIDKLVASVVIKIIISALLFIISYFSVKRNRQLLFQELGKYLDRIKD